MSILVVPEDDYCCIPMGKLFPTLFFERLKGWVVVPEAATGTQATSFSDADPCPSGMTFQTSQTGYAGITENTCQVASPS
jgi:hypothetical protein